MVPITQRIEALRTLLELAGETTGAEQIEYLITALGEVLSLCEDINNKIENRTGEGNGKAT
jgi:hypothetical protein